MWAFWIVTGLLAAAAAALVISRAGAAARLAQAAPQDPALPLYRRQLSELDEQAGQGLLGPEEHRAARAEAARRLLRFADTQATPETTGGRMSRLVATLCAAMAAALALLVYLKLGASGLPDQPYAARLEAWRRADPGTLDPARMAAVLREIARQRPHDPQAYDYLGRAEMAAGDAFGAGRAFATAASLAPGRADLRASEGEALVMDAGGKLTLEAVQTFQQTLHLDPRNPAARYYVGRAQIAGGDTAGGLSAWRALLADLPPDEPRRAALQTEIERVRTGQAPGMIRTSPTNPQRMAGLQRAPLAGPQAAFIHAMVARQAAELKAAPDDPRGWARLVRSYGVLGDAAAQAAALTEARRLFAGRPADLASIEAQASPRPGG
ncbi:c-type cytochrome biogenesis protein CcmI [Caulobacter sp. S45]|uniref:c-type cytochrome biogenesis protein CcmI n=1 Tax=Caulobacter sp. S45 TaxID=1641861 RepID=UPI0015751A89|nr:c-type cytochrome biogenesis protein CcmI [Caulobacter sp. S45]